MKKTIGISIIVFILTYFLVGYVFVLKGWLSNDFYTFSIAIISGVASVVTIFSMFASTSLKNELNGVQPALLDDITKNLQTINDQQSLLENTKNKLSEQEKQLLLLQIKKGELEFIIKKTSLAIFLNDQLDRNAIRIKEIIESNRELIECIENRKSIENKLTQLNEEIQRDENYEFFYELLQRDDFQVEKKPIIFSNIIIKKMYSLFHDEY